MYRCFVIGPIGDRLAPLGSPGRQRYEDALRVYEEVIAAACAQVGLSPIRADHIATSGEITEQVFRHLYEDEVVIADVTGGNPNVMYELGLRHTRNLLTIQVGEYGQLPFDVQAIRTIQFSTSEAGLIDARNRLVGALNIGLAEGGDPVTATKVWMRDLLDSSAEALQEQTGLDLDVEDVDEGVGLVDAMVSVESAFPRLTQRMESITADVHDFGAITERSGQEMSAMSSSGAGSAAERLTFIRKFSGEIEQVAESVETHVDEFVADMEEIDGGVNGVLAYLEQHYHEYTSSVDEFLVALIGLGGTARDGLEGFNKMDAGLKMMGDISRLLRPPTQRLSKAFRRMIDKARLMDEWEAAAFRLRSRVPEPIAGDGQDPVESEVEQPERE